MPELTQSPNPAQDAALTQTTPKKAMSLREAMNQDFESKGVRTGQTKTREPNERLPGQGGEGDHFSGKDLTEGPKSRERRLKEEAQAAGGDVTTETEPKPVERKSGVGGFTDTKPEGLEAPPEPERDEAADAAAEAARASSAEDDIDSIRLHPNASKESQEGWEVLKGKTKEYRTKYLAEQQKTKQLEEAMKSGQTLTPELKAQIDKADEVLRTLDLKSHPQFYTQYQEPIDNGLTKLFETIEEAWNPETNKDWLPKWKEDVKRLGVDAIDKEWWKTNVLDKIEDPDLKHEASQQIRSLYRLKSTRDSQISTLSDKQKYDAWVGETWKKQSDNYNQQFMKAANEVSKELADRGFKWAQPIKITEGMDATAKQRAEAHNAEHQKAATIFAEACGLINGYNPDETPRPEGSRPGDHARVAATYTLAKRLEADMEALTTERDTLLTKVEKMQKELDGYKRVRSANGKPAATHAGPATKPAPKLGTGPKGARAALDEMAEEFMRGS
jgi:hypothetical protein